MITEPKAITDEMVSLAHDIEAVLGLRHLSLLGVVSVAYLAGWRDAMAQENPAESLLPEPQPMSAVEAS